MKSKLLNPNQSGFMSGDSCIHQLISVTHDPSLEVRGIYIYILYIFIFKAYRAYIYKAYRVWHEGLIY